MTSNLKEITKMLEQFFSTRDVATILGVTTKAVEKWRREGRLRPLKAGSLCRYPEDEIRRFLGLEEDGTVSAGAQLDENLEPIGELGKAKGQDKAA